MNDTQGLHQISDMTHGGVNLELRSIMRWMYTGITRCNFIMENKDNIEFNGKDKIIAETRFLRAYYYFELVKFFGDVPLVIDKELVPKKLPKFQEHLLQMFMLKLNRT